jgi:hypothetical protein
VYFTAEQHQEVQRFIREEPSARVQALMIVGTIKSGKSTLLHEVLPGLLAAAYATRWPAGRPRPVIFKYAFPLGRDAEAAAAHLQDELGSFGRRVNVPFDKEPSPSAALNVLPTNLRIFAERIRAGGGELWLLLDELQGPGLGSTPLLAQYFTYMFKQVRTAGRDAPRLSFSAPWPAVAV